MYLLGYDIGSSSIKAALLDAGSGRQLAVVQSPATEMAITALEQGWAEQDPAVWWANVCLATGKLLDQTRVNPASIKGIGISYQMHGLVLVDERQQVLRPAIIWCDSRAVRIGDAAFEQIGAQKCLAQMLNSPGNFTASKLKWVKENEPGIYQRVHKMMLPGDYIAMRLTGEIHTTISGLSEGVLWDFQANAPASPVLDCFGFAYDVLPGVLPACSLQGNVTPDAAAATGLQPGTPVAYRAGDQPNNALSLNVLEAGEVAATGGTSGVVYGVVDEPLFDPQSRVNSFAHINHEAGKPRIGVLLCINGAGSQYSWIKRNIAGEQTSYPDMENAAEAIPPGSSGLRILPFGNGAERMLHNKVLGAQINNLQLNQHHKAHLYRAALEGIAFSFVYGMKILQSLGLDVAVIRAGNDNLFQSAVFSSTISNLIGSRIEVFNTTGAIGAAKAAGVATGLYASLREAVQHTEVDHFYEPANDSGQYAAAYAAWLGDLEQLLLTSG